MIAQKTLKLMTQLKEVDCSFARYWNTEAAEAFVWALANAADKRTRALSLALQKAGYSLSGRNEGILESLLEFNTAVIGRNKIEEKNLLHRLSDGQIKEVA